MPKRRPPPPRLRGHLHQVPALSAPGWGHRALSIYLPPHYFQSQERYPLALFFDGQNVFGHEGSFAGGWLLHEALDQRASKGKRVPVVAAIHHGGHGRTEELSPWGLHRRARAKGDAFLDWVSGPLIRSLEAELRLESGPESRLLAGSSLGGLMALYGFFRHPEVFGGALSMSPSLWVGGGAIFPFVAQQSLPWTRKLYLDCGQREGRGQAFRQAKHMAQLLEAQGFQPGQDLMWRPDSKGAHNERNWGRRLPKALRFFYG